MISSRSVRPALVVVAALSVFSLADSMAIHAAEPLTLSDHATKVVATKPADLSRDLVMYYSFDHDQDGEVYDESDNGNNGVTVGAVKYEESFRGRAVRFTSRDTYILSDATALNMHGWKQVTVSAWINTRRVTTYSQIINRGEVTGENTSGISLRAGSRACKATFSFRRQFGANPPDSEHLWSSTLQPQNMNRVDRWVHLVGTFDGRFLRFYINGKLDREVECASDNLHLWDNPEHKLVIGNASNKSRMRWYDKYFDGLVDEVRIWKRGLNEDEVAVLYARDAERAAAFKPQVVAAEVKAPAFHVAAP